MSKKVSQDWAVLQKKIFSRWVKQKLHSKNIPVNDVLVDLHDGKVLRALVETLSERQYNDKTFGKWTENCKNDYNKIDNINCCMKFIKDCGITFKITPNVEDIMRGDEKTILGIIWALILKFVRFDDDDSDLDATKALLLWVRNKTHEYKNVEIGESYTNSFASGMALCAIIHKHRPKLINYDSLNPKEPLSNFDVALNAANNYFDMERYIEPNEIVNLDEKCLFIFVSEFYYGIAEQRKLDLAARRISKLIIKTKENDRLKALFNEKAKEFKERVADVKVTLNDIVIDNTLAGAKKRIEEFYHYKTNKKIDIVRLQLELEALFTNIQTRLTQMKRPPFKPFEGLTLADINNTVKELEKTELQRSVKLHEELNRQLKLHNLNSQHSERFKILKLFGY
jgi:hypothetical protein